MCVDEFKRNLKINRYKFQTLSLFSVKINKKNKKRAIRKEFKHSKSTNKI